ncbi:MAG: DNA polymerase III subunit alpha [Nitriliruptorales bacterium]|nr:DNA polymerase III subunit alpha [Nitriliruptorales bacterium]
MVGPGAERAPRDDDFVHLHVHSEYSMLDGATRVDDLIDVVSQDGQQAVAITDHGVLFGLVEFHDRARAAGVNPILGCEMYLAHGSRRDQQMAIDGSSRYYHLTTLATDDTGYRNLVELSTRSYTDGLWGKQARIDKELLAECNDGLIVLSGCLSGEAATAIVVDDEPAAKQSLSDFRDILGPDRFFVELMDHGIPDQRKVWATLERMAGDLGLATVITNDSHYTRAEDAYAHDALLCVQTQAQLDDEDRFRFNGEKGYHVRTRAEMWEQFGSVAPDALRATVGIAERCNVELEFGQDLLPAFPCPPGLDEAGFLRQKVFEGAARRYGTPLPTAVTERLEYELGVIEQMGFPAYFLIVADLCEHAREVGIRVGPGRGSAGGSAVAYCTGITEVDPIRFGLIFERFLNPDRISMPDIDMDFDDRRRGEMIAYAAERYGKDHVAQIVTFATIKAKSAIRDAARVLGPERLGRNPFDVGDELCKMMPPPVQGREAPLHDAYEQSAELNNAKRDATYQQVLDLAEKLEGLKRQHGIHAAAVLISAKPLVETIPLMKTARGEVVTQYEMNAAEALGLLKMDFLGLRNLTVISDAEEQIRDNRGVAIDMSDPRLLGDLDDPAPYELLQRGDTLGIFQLDSSGIQSLVRLMQPDSFDDIMALLALFRPGPLGQQMHVEYCERKHGRADVSYLLPELEPVLRDTYGVIVYQEQVMRIAVDLAGYTMGQADSLRKAMGKKKADVMAAQRQSFVDGAVGRGLPRAKVVELWQHIEKFAEYGFNKSHTCAYGVISYQTAWLKAHYPVEFMSALLTSVKNNKDTKPVYLNECRRLGIPVLPPDVNASNRDFTAVGDEIRFGLSAVRGVGDSVVEAIVSARRAHGAFESFPDFCDKVDAAALNKRVVEALAKAGAFASLGHTRRGVLESFEPIVDAALSRKKAEAAGQYSLFDGGDVPDPGFDLDNAARHIPDLEFDKGQLLALEQEMLGLYVSDHPLFGVEQALDGLVSHDVQDLRDQSSGATVSVGGVLTGVQKKFTRKGDTYATATLEDLTGGVDVVFWPGTYKEASAAIVEHEVIVVTGRLEVRDEAISVKVSKVVVPDLSEARGEPVVVTFGHGQLTVDAVERLTSVLAAHRGAAPVAVEITEGDGSIKRLQLGDEHRVVRRPGLFAELKATFGPDAVRDARTRTYADPSPQDRRHPG